MRRLISVVVVTLLGVLAASGPVALSKEKIRVVATIPDLKVLTEAVGGDLVDVDVLARGTQNAHEIEVRPSLMLKIRRADVLILNGLDLERWADVAVQGSNNANIIRGGIGWIDASRGVPLLEVPTARVDRSMGDVHPLGNPHYTLDPGLAPIVTQNIVDGLSRVVSEHRATFERNRTAFLARLDQAMSGWLKTMQPFAGAKVVVYHPQWIYFLTRFGLQEAGWVEEHPGIPPSPQHLVRLIQKMKNDQVKVVIYAAWNDQKLAGRVAEEAKARAVLLAPMVGGVKGADSYVALFDYNINALAQALR